VLLHPFVANDFSHEALILKQPQLNGPAQVSTVAAITELTSSFVVSLMKS
jgi:hypothetical protein